MKYKPGDILLFSGEGFLSHLTKWFTWSNFSHVGVITPLGLFESQKLSNIPDIDGIFKKGVQIVNTDDRIRLYEGNVYYRKIRGEFKWNQGLSSDFYLLHIINPSVGISSSCWLALNMILG